jgi:hypothetical protein
VNGSLEGHACANAEPPAKGRRWANWLRPFDLSLHLPWVNRHNPYIALHVTTWGYEGSASGWRRIVWIQLMWGRLFTDHGGSKVWQPRGTTE